MAKKKSPDQPLGQWAVHGAVSDAAGRAIAVLHVSADRPRIGQPEPLGVLTAVAEGGSYHIPFNPIRDQGTCHA